MAENDINNEEMPELYGKVAKEAWALSNEEPDPTKRKIIRQGAEQASTQYRTDMQLKAQEDTYGCTARFIMFLPISWKAKCILGRIWSFQRKGGDCHLSVKKMAEIEFNCNLKNLEKDLQSLVNAGWLLRISKGSPRPAAYMLNVVVCLEAAIANGWEPYQNPAEKQEAEAKQG